MATSYLTPGIYIEEIPSGARPIEAVGTSTAGFVGCAPETNARKDEAVAINNWSQFVKEFSTKNASSTPLSLAVHGFFQNGGRRCYVVNVGEGSLVGSGRARGGIAVLEEIDDISIVAAPGYTDAASYDTVLSHCEKRKDRVAILDAPRNVRDIDSLKKVATPRAVEKKRKPGEDADAEDDSTAEGGARPRNSDNGFGAFYFPWIRMRDPFSPQQIADAPPSGHLAGIYGRTDATRGVHKAPANETIRGALDLTYRVTGDEQAELNSNGVNCIRLFPNQGIRVWGARTLADSGSEWRYLNVRRLFNMIEEAIARGTRWVVFEPNDLSLWQAIRRDIGAFLTLLWRQGALRGATPEEAFFCQCDAETNPEDVINAGMVVAVIGIAPVKPAEFVIFRIGQSSGGAEIQAEGGN